MELFNKEQRISIQFPKNKKFVEMFCTIEEVYNDRLVLVLPQYFMRYIKYLQVGARVTAKAFTNIGTIDFNAVIINSPLEDTFSIELDLNALKLTPDTEQATVEAVEKLTISMSEGDVTCNTISISADRLRFRIDEPITLQEIYDFKLYLPEEYGIIDFSARITEQDEVYDEEYEATFVTIADKAKQTLLYYMYMNNN